MRRVGTFKTKESKVEACLWMVRNPESFRELAELEWKVE
jgi:hypothetical protein